MKKCKGCNEKLKKEEVENSLSRYAHGYICSDCGTKETLEGNFIARKENKCAGCDEPILENQSSAGDRHTSCI